MRRIAVVTGARAEYGYLKPLLRRIQEHSGLELLLYVTGLHLVKEYGNTIEEIIKDGLIITRTVDMDVKVENNVYDMTVSVGKGVTGFANALVEDSPQILAILGDRIEILSAAIAATSMNIPIAHMGGGEVGLGDIDDSIRHAVTKFAHLHFASSKQSKERVLKLGEESWRVFQVGALSLDTILDAELMSKEELCQKYDISNKSIILTCYHPTTTEWHEAEKQMGLVMQAVSKAAKEEDMEIVVIYPNAYPGGYQIINVIREYADEYGNIHIFESIPHLDYISLMNIASVFVGNSSSGIIEAPSLGVPYVCVGTRQQGRERANNVVDVEYDQDEISLGIKRALFDKEFLNIVRKCESPYGDGKASDKIVKVLSEISIDKKLLQKRITY